MDIETQKKVLRELRGVHKTQEQFAQELRMPTSSYVAVELGFRKISTNFLQKIKNRYPEFDTNIFFEK